MTHVVNYECPDTDATYVHRIGRTGRAGRNGVAVTLVDWADVHRWKLIDQALDLGKPEPVETYSSSPHLYSDLDIPEGTKGRIATAPPKRDKNAEKPHGQRERRRTRSSKPRRRRRVRNGVEVVREPHDKAQPPSQ